jgi:23S rRNA pseudouridine2605 synthase
MRINKFLAHFSGLSRRSADTAIVDGQVSVNGKPAEKGQTVSKNDKVLLDGVAVEEGQYSYILFHKPVGVITSRAKQGEVETIYSVLPKQLSKLKPVGRLDKNTSGLLILTDDGELAQHLTHPKHSKQKLYRLTLREPLDAGNLALIQGPGVELDDGISKFSVRPSTKNDRLFFVTLKEGRNRQIRRSFEALGNHVKTLHRYEMNGLTLEGLKSGEYRRLTDEELEEIQS